MDHNYSEDKSAILDGTPDVCKEGLWHRSNLRGENLKILAGEQNTMD